MPVGTTGNTWQSAAQRLGLNFPAGRRQYCAVAVVLAWADHVIPFHLLDQSPGTVAANALLTLLAGDGRTSGPGDLGHCPVVKPGVAVTAFRPSSSRFQILSRRLPGRFAMILQHGDRLREIIGIT